MHEHQNEQDKNTKNVDKSVISEILDKAKDGLSVVSSFYDLDQFKSKYTGKNSYISTALKGLTSLQGEQRRKVGSQLNAAREKIIGLIAAKEAALKTAEVLSSLSKDKIDVTLPGRGEKLGSIHPITKVRYEVEDFFRSFGCLVIEGDEIEDVFHNFIALNIPETHPAMGMHDTFYLEQGQMGKNLTTAADRLLLRTHTSPVQIRAMKKYGAPLRMVTAGRVYRKDYDATHSPMFNQMEGLFIDKGLNFAHLKNTLYSFLRYFFGAGVKIRFRSSYFPFTEPSAEVDIGVKSVDGSYKWLEILGCGMIHPNVLKFGGITPEEYTGFAFGVGLDRLAMLKYKIDDLRLFFINELEFLQQ